MSARAAASPTLVLRSSAESETESLAAKLAPLLEPGDVVALCGPLGAGKTCFVRGLARGLEAAARVRSPTFTIVNEYHGRIPLLHLDLYRLEPRELEPLGLDERREDAAIVVEWGERLTRPFLADALTVVFEPAGDARVLTVSASGRRSGVLLSEWRRAKEGAA